MDESDVTRMPAVRLAADVRAGRVAAAEVIDAHLAVIAARNPGLNALPVAYADQARRAADDVDALVAAGRDPGPLAGVPISVKENIDLAWSATTQGWRGAAGAVPAEDATIVRRVRDAGGVPISRGNMPDFGMRWDTDNDLYGRTFHPLDPGRTVYGSSGGDAVAVSTGMSAIGLGNDFGGSVRLPASALGICGLRPSFGRVPRAAVRADPVMPTLQQFSVNGPLARTVDDLALALGVLEGVDADDPVSLDVRPASEMTRRVAVTRMPPGGTVDDDIAAGVDAAAAALAAAGWEVEHVDPPHLEEAAVLWRRLACTDMAISLAPDRLPVPLGWSATAFLRDGTAAAVPYESAADYAQAWARRAVIAADWRRFQREHPVLLGPVATERLPAIDFDLGGPDATTTAWRMLRLVVAVNFLGLPAVTVPAGVDRDGLPVGVQLIAPLHADAWALAAARDVEAGLAVR
ncbi:amidase family protein [Microbacterium sp. 1P10UB]|uniref:amidase n=1 Tax=unclassified Microbacterium TaxID=2609290 RepID=UPI0039A391B3